VNKIKQFLLVAASIGTFLPSPSYAVEILSDLTYAVVLPENYDTEKFYPAVLALPPGDQGRQMVESSLQSYWGFGKPRGYIVVNPVAPDGVSFLDGSEEKIPVLLDEVARQYKIEGGRFHIGGISNGGISAFRIAENHPKRFCSLAALPGLPANDRDFERLTDISNLPMLLVVGERDGRWVGRMRETQEKITGLGGSAELHVLPGAGHSVHEGFSPQELFSWLDQQRKACRGD
jgi:pimeloyl-ACP methyl ester carboxylesterase